MVVNFSDKILLLDFLCANYRAPRFSQIGMSSEVFTEGDISPLETNLEEASGVEITTNMTSVSKQVAILKQEIPTVMVAGRPRSGKSTALNNIFGLNLVTRISASSVTKSVQMFEVTKKIPKKQDDTSPQEEVTMQVIDTPGLGALDISKYEILKDMKTVLKGVNFILLYCFSVSPSNSLTEIDKTIVANLYQALGEKMRSKCVLLFTFSDHVYWELEDSPDKYKHHINRHAQEFQKMLQDIADKDSCIKSIFEYNSTIVLSEEENPSNIIAIPVKKKVSQSKDILPGMINSGQDWTDVVFIELIKRIDHTQRQPFILFKYPNIVIAMGTTTVGATAGAVVGGVIGVLGGPLGIAGGAAAGAAIAGATGLTVKAIVHLVNLIKNK